MVTECAHTLRGLGRNPCTVFRSRVSGSADPYEITFSSVAFTFASIIAAVPTLIGVRYFRYFNNSRRDTCSMKLLRAFQRYTVITVVT